MDELVNLYKQGLSLPELSERFGIYYRTAAAHLNRRSVPSRPRGLIEEQVPEAMRLYENGMTLTAVGLLFGVSQQAVRQAIAKRGITIRPRGRHLEPGWKRPGEEKDPTPEAPGGIHLG